MQGKKPYFEDVEVGMEIPGLVKKPTSIQLFRFSALTWNPHRIHYDKDYAMSEGLPNVLVQGELHGSFLAQMITDWIGENGELRRLGWMNRGVGIPGDELTCSGKVIKKYTQGGSNYVELELLEVNQRKETLLQGTATVTLSSRSGK